MTEPSVETAEGRAELRRLADREYSLEPDWYVSFQAALHALDTRDAALAEQMDRLEVLRRSVLRNTEYAASLEVQLASAQAALQAVENWSRDGMAPIAPTLEIVRKALRDPGT